MVMQNGQMSYVQPIPDSANSLVQAVYKVCYDQIVTLAVVDNTQDRLFGRLNIPRDSTGPPLSECSGTKKLPRFWDAVHYGLCYLENEQQGTALVTLWASRYLKGEKSPEYALPVGFAVGKEKNVLTQVPQQTILKPVVREMEGKGINIWALWPDITSSNKVKQLELQNYGENQLDSLIRAVEHAIKGSTDPEVPASVLQLHPDCTFLLDKEAASIVSEG